MLPTPVARPRIAEPEAPPAAATASDGPPRGRAAAVWPRLALACALLGAAGGLRAWQERRVDARLASGLEAPFPLAELPLEVGDWRGAAAELDPRIAQNAGSIDSTLRSYVNRRTGVRLEVIALYGPAAGLRIHAPERCYPQAGYEPVGDVLHHEVDAGPGRPAAQFRSLVYAKGEGGRAERQEVYYAWR